MSRSSRPRWGRWLAAVSALVVLLIGAAPGSGATTGSIAGTVTNAVSHAAISGIDVDVYNASTGAFVTVAFTGTNGRYQVSGLASGSYKVGFGTQSHLGGNFVAQFYNAKASLQTATPVSVLAGASTTGISATLRPGASITGKVVSAATQTAIALVQAGVFNASTGAYVAGAKTDFSGTYTVRDLPAGTYKIAFTNVLYIEQFYNGKSSLATATPVSVAAGATASSINAGLVKKPVGRITGTVTDAATHAAVVGAFVSVLTRSGAYVTSTFTSATGAYTASVPGGSWKVEFSQGCHFAQYYKNAISLAGATAVTVTVNATTPGIDGALHLSGTLKGTVRDASSGTGLPGAGIVILDALTGNLVTLGTSDASGQWSMCGLQSGTYKVGFVELGSDYVRQFFNGKPSLASANAVALTAGTTIPGVNAALQHGAKISGTVTDSLTHSPLFDATVTLYTAAGAEVGTALTGSDGTYIFNSVNGLGIPTGSYKVSFAASGYATLYYNHQASLSSANPITATAGSTVSAINGALALAPSPVRGRRAAVL